MQPHDDQAVVQTSYMFILGYVSIRNVLRSWQKYSGLKNVV